MRGEPFGPEADVYSLGAVLVEAVTGEQAFAGATPAEVAMVQLHREPPDLAAVAGVPPHVARAAQEALAKDAAQRPTAPALAARLRRGRLRSGSDDGGGPRLHGDRTGPGPPPSPRRTRCRHAQARRSPLPPVRGAGSWRSASWHSYCSGPARRTRSPTRTTTAAALRARTPTTAAPAATTAPVAPVTTQPPATTAAPTTTAPTAASGDLSAAAVTYVETLDAGDFESAWALTSPAFRSAQDRSSWESYWSIWETIEIVGEPQVDEGSGTVVLPLSYDGSEEAYQLTFVQGENGRWLVDGPVGR